MLYSPLPADHTENDRDKEWKGKKKKVVGWVLVSSPPRAVSTIS